MQSSEATVSSLRLMRRSCSVTRSTARKLPQQARWDHMGICEWNRCIVSSLAWESDSHWLHGSKYGNKRFEKGRRSHR